MCLESMLSYALSTIPVVNYFSKFIMFMIFIFALYFAFTTQSALQIMCAYFCPLLYIIYYFAIKK